METPQSSRRITRSQALAMAPENSNSHTTTTIVSSRDENEEFMTGVSKSRQKNGKHQEREKSALFDITNGSPIVGLATGSLKTPLYSKKRMMISNTETKNATTPGSGESLLRGQVKTLLQKVEEEGVISKISFEPNPLFHKRFLNSPMAVLAPTPANTPQVYDFSTTNKNGLESFIVSPVAENFNFTQMLQEVISSPDEEDKGENVTRSLFMDFSEKFEVSEDASLWSVQVNASTSEEYKDDEDCADCNDDGIDEICDGISKISVANFTGKHIRFVYNSDGELEGEEEESSSPPPPSSSSSSST
ncbi:hypothetical protein LXL04_007263 [Taraxacum kok-saghyz]